MLLIAVMGPTASGKSAVAEAIADRLDAELLNADAFQVYRGMDIGTAKPDRRERYRLLDLKDPDESYGVGEYVLDAAEILRDAYSRGRHAVVVGGTGLYVRALFEEYAGMGQVPPSELREELMATPVEALATRLREEHPEVAARIDLQNPVRVRRALERILAPSPSIPLRLPEYAKLKLAIVPDVSETDARITRRAEQMVQNGWIQEVRNLVDLGYKSDDPGFRAIGYRTLCRYLDGEVELGDAVATTIAETKRYAKRQRSWLRSEPNLNQLNVDDALSDVMRRIELELKG